jgi:hypothetical protein
MNRGERSERTTFGDRVAQSALHLHHPEFDFRLMSALAQPKSCDWLKQQKNLAHLCLLIRAEVCSLH